MGKKHATVTDLAGCPVAVTLRVSGKPRQRTARVGVPHGLGSLDVFALGRGIGIGLLWPACYDLTPKEWAKLEAKAARGRLDIEKAFAPPAGRFRRHKLPPIVLTYGKALLRLAFLPRNLRLLVLDEIVSVVEGAILAGEEARQTRRLGGESNRVTIPKPPGWRPSAGRPRHYPPWLVRQEEFFHTVALRRAGGTIHEIAQTVFPDDPQGKGPRLVKEWLKHARALGLLPTTPR